MCVCEGISLPVCYLILYSYARSSCRIHQYATIYVYIYSICNLIATGGDGEVTFFKRYAHLYHILCANLESIDETRLLFAHKVLRLFVIDAQLEDLQNWIACQRNESQKRDEEGGECVNKQCGEGGKERGHSTHICPSAASAATQSA